MLEIANRHKVYAYDAYFVGAVLEKAKKEGKVLIKKRDGSSFILSPHTMTESSLNVKGISADINSKEIIDILKQVRAR